MDPPLHKGGIFVYIVASAILCQTYTNAKEVTLTDEDFANIGKYEPDEESKKTIDPTSSGKFEGDIDLNGKPLELYLKPKGGDIDPDKQGNAVRDPYLKWPNGVIPYSISSDFNTAERSLIAAGMRDFHSNTCIRFVPRTNQNNYVYIFKGGGCYSMVGMVRNRQSLSLGNGCVTKGIAIHEMMHAAGFFHEQSRNDRDSYIAIYWNNIYSGSQGQFKKYDLRTIDHLGTAYDYGSVMHYGPYAFSQNRQRTIVPRQSGVTIGQRVGLSQNDIRKLNIFYRCNGGGVVTSRPVTSRPTGGCRDSRQDCDYYYRQNRCSPSWMWSACKRTCGRCDGSSRRTTRRPRPATRRPTPPPRPPTRRPRPSSCRDRMSSWVCSTFARKGYCTGPFSGYMSRNCCSSCSGRG